MCDIYSKSIRLLLLFFYEVIYFFNNPIEIEQFGKVEEGQHTQVTISFLMNI